jgi:lysozyme
MNVNDSLTTSKEGLEHITKWEGLVLKRYICPAGKPTIGVGHVILPGENYQEITKEQALEILAKDVERFESAVKKHITIPLNQNQFDALVSFIFNTGEGGLVNTGVQRAVNSGFFASVPAKLEEWSKFRVDGVLKVNKGLLNRRKSEAQLFMKPVDVPSCVPPKMTMWTKESLMKAQEKLLKMGLYKMKVDGLWGPGTSAALENFSKQRGLSLGNQPKVEILSETYEALMSSKGIIVN